MRLCYRVALMVFACGGCWGATGQLTPCDNWANSIATATSADVNPRVEELGSITDSFDCFVYMADQHLGNLANLEVLTRNVHAQIFQAAIHTNNQQLSSPTGSAGAVTPVSQPETPTSVIADYGGLTSSSKGSSTTLQFNPDIPIAQAYESGLLHYCTPAFDTDCDRETGLAILHKLSIGLDFDTSTSTGTVTGRVAATTSSGSQQPATATTSSSGGATFAGVTAKYVLLWTPAGKVDYSKIPFERNEVAAYALGDYAGKKQDYVRWNTCFTHQLKSVPSGSDRASTIKQIIDTNYIWALAILFYDAPFTCGASPPALPMNGAQIDSKFVQLFAAAVAADTQLAAEFAAAQLNALKTALVSAEYDHHSPQNQPSYSTYVLTVSCSFGHGIKNCAAPSKEQNASAAGNGRKPNSVTNPEDHEWSLAFNVGGSVYDSTPSPAISGGSILRSIQTGVELDKNLPPPSALKWLGSTTVGGVYYYQDLTSPSVLKVTPGTPLTGISLTGLPSNATTIFGQKGPINIAQLRWGLGTGKKVKFPIAFSYSNRTELITHHVWGLQFGISYDFSALVPRTNSSNGTQVNGSNGGQNSDAQ